MTSHAKPQKGKGPGRPERPEADKNGASGELPFSGEMYRTIFENTGTAIIIIEDDGLISLANREFEKISGYSVGEIAGLKKWMDFMAPEDLDFMVSQHRLRRVSPDSALRRYECRLIDRAGKVHDISLTVDLVPGTKQSVASMMDITERRKAEEAVRRSEKEYGDLYGNMPDGFISIDLTGRIREVNLSFEAITGYSAEELRSMTYRDLTPEKWLAMEKDIIDNQVLKRGYSDIFEKEYRRKDGSIVPVELHTFVSRDKDGTLEKIWAIVRDISERKRAEKALQAGREEVRLIMASSLDAILQMDPSGKLYSANPAACEMFGRTEEELQSVGRSGFIDVADPRVAAALEERRRTGRFQGEVTFMRKDGSRFTGELSSVIYRDGEGRERTSMVVRDMTEREMAEKALRASEALFSGIFNSSPLGIAILRRSDGSFLNVNESWEKVMGFSREETVGKGALSLIKYAGPAELEKVAGMLGSAEARYEIEISLLRKTGERIEFLMTAVPIKAAGEDCLLTTGLEITERKRAEETRRLSEERFEIAFKGSPIGMAMTSIPEGKYVDVNEALLKATGYSREDLIGKVSTELGILDWAEREDLIYRVESTGPVYSMEMHYRRKTGQVRDCLMSMARVAVGTEYYYLSSTLDITERKRIETAAQESEAFIRAVLGRLPIGVAIYSSPPVVFEYMNDNFVKFYRTSRKALEAPDAFWDAVYEDPVQREEIRKKIRADVASGDIERMVWTDIPITRRGEETTFVSEMIVPIREKKRISIVSDVTDRIRNEESLRKRLRYEETLSRISSQAAAASDMESFQEEALERLGTELDVSRVYIFEYRKETDTGDNTHEWTALGCRAQKDEFQNIPACSMPWWMEQMRRNTVLNFADIEDIPDEKTREILRDGDIRSVLIVPLFVGGELYGFMGFDECRRKRDWPVEDVDLLVSISRIISGAFERKQTERRLAEQLDELRRWQSVTLGRETRLLDLKREINDLLRRAGLPPRYSSSEGEES